LYMFTLYIQVKFGAIDKPPNSYTAATLET